MEILNGRSEVFHGLALDIIIDIHWLLSVNEAFIRVKYLLRSRNFYTISLHIILDVLFQKSSLKLEPFTYIKRFLN